MGQIKISSFSYFLIVFFSKCTSKPFKGIWNFMLELAPYTESNYLWDSNATELVLKIELRYCVSTIIKETYSNLLWYACMWQSYSSCLYAWVISRMHLESFKMQMLLSVKFKLVSSYDASWILFTISILVNVDM